MLMKFDRAIYVAPNGTFKTLQAAINAGALLGPTITAPVIVKASPGTYTENVVLAPFVYLSVLDETSNVGTARSVIISGTLTASSVSAISDAFAMRGIRVTGTTTLRTDLNTGAGASFVNFNFSNCLLGGAGTFTGRAAFPASDLIRMAQCRPTTITVTDIGYASIGSGHAGTTTFSGATAASGINGTSMGAVVLNGTATYSQDSGTIGNVTSNNGTSADIRGTLVTGTMASAGTGAINRSVINGSTGALGIGATVIAFAVPLKDANYNVHHSQTAGVATTNPIVTLKTAAGYTATVVGAGTFDYTMIHN